MPDICHPPPLPESHKCCPDGHRRVTGAHVGVSVGVSVISTWARRACNAVQMDATPSWLWWLLDPSLSPCEKPEWYTSGRSLRPNSDRWSRSLGVAYRPFVQVGLLWRMSPQHAQGRLGPGSMVNLDIGTLREDFIFLNTIHSSGSLKSGMTSLLTFELQYLSQCLVLSWYL